MKLHENCGAVRLHLLLVAIFIYATAHSQHLYQPRLIEGSPNAWSYKGAGTAGNPPLVSGVPSITYNIPAGKNRVMFISVFIERNQGTYPNSNLAYDPDGVGFYSLSYGSAKVGNLTPAKLTRNQAAFYKEGTEILYFLDYYDCYYLSDSSGLPTGNTVISFPGLTTPENAGDEIVIFIQVFENAAQTPQNVATLKLLGTNLNNFTYNGAAPVSPTGNKSHITYVTNTYLSQQGSALTLSEGWTSTVNMEVVNNGGTSVLGNFLDIYTSEHDGVRFMSAYRTGITGNPSFSYSKGNSNFILRSGSDMYALLPLMRPGLSGTVYIDNDGLTGGVNNGGTGGGVWNSANSLWVNAVEDGVVIATAAVSNTGVFSFPAGGGLVEGSTLQFQLSKTQGTIGSAAPAKQLPPNWKTVGESITSGPSDGSPDGQFTITIGTTSPANNTTYRFAVTKTSADVSIVKTVDKPTPRFGSNVVFTLVAGNAGPDPALDVTAIDLLPSGYTYVSHTYPTVGTFNNGTGVWNIGTMLKDGQASMTITARVNTNGEYANTATITTTTFDPVPGNNTSTATTIPFDACAITASNPDSDGDGISDFCDLDDDNDGIPDAVECARIYADYSSATISATANVTGAVSTLTWGGVTGTLTRVHNGTTNSNGGGLEIVTQNLSNQNIFTPHGSVSQPVIRESITTYNNTTNYTRYTLTLSEPVESITLHVFSFDYMRTRFTGNHKELLVSGGTELVYDAIKRQLYDIDPSTSSVGVLGRDGFGSVRITSTDGSPINEIIFEKFDDPNSTGTGDGFSFTFSVEPICDMDGDGIPNRLDLDSDGDGCYDAIEGDENVMSANLNAVGRITGEVNANGVPKLVNFGGTADVDGKEGQGAGLAYIFDAAVAGITSSNQHINTGTAPASLKLTGSSGSIQWQVSTDNVTYSNVATGGTTASYDPGVLTAPGFYRAVVTSAGGCTVVSNVVAITINNPPIALNDSYMNPLSKPVVLTPLVNDSDPDADEVSIVSINGVTLTGVYQIIPVPNGHVEILAEGNISFIPDAGFYGTVNLPYVITDEMSTATANIEVIINALLPVRLLNFTVDKTVNNKALLSWSTAMEQNNEGFAIESSANGKDWSAIEYVRSKAPKGYSNIVINYSFVDENVTKGTTYYRLKQVDFDGQFEYSPVKKLILNHNQAITIYPNPVTDNISIKGLTGNEIIRITDITGKLILQQKATGDLLQLNLPDLSNGTYILITTDSKNISSVRKFIKLKQSK